jgi:hypothetical protein
MADFGFFVVLHGTQSCYATPSQLRARDKSAGFRFAQPLTPQRTFAAQVSGVVPAVSSDSRDGLAETIMLKPRSPDLSSHYRLF